MSPEKQVTRGGSRWTRCQEERAYRKNSTTTAWHVALHAADAPAHRTTRQFSTGRSTTHSSTQGGMGETLTPYCGTSACRVRRLTKQVWPRSRSRRRRRGRAPLPCWTMLTLLFPSHGATCSQSVALDPSYAPDHQNYLCMNYTRPTPLPCRDSAQGWAPRWFDGKGRPRFIIYAYSHKSKSAPRHCCAPWLRPQAAHPRCRPPA